MSLILDALNRSRQDDGQIPSLATQHYEEVVEGHRNRYQLVLVLALLSALSVIGWLLWDREGDAEVVMPAAAPGSLSTAVPSPQLPAAEIPPVERPVSDGEGSDQPAISPQPVSATPGVAELYRQQAPAQPAAQSAAEPVASVEEPTPARPAAATPVRQEQPIDIEAMVGQAQAELADAKLAQHEAPFIAKLSQQTKDGIPTILYQRHDYSGTAVKSTVVLNGKTLKVGARTAAGVTIEEILPDSVVLSYKGTRFRLRALNSWVNL